VSNHGRLPDDERGPKRLEADVVLEVKIAPCEFQEEPPNGRISNDWKWMMPGRGIRGFGDNPHLMAGSRPFLRKQSGHRFDTADTGGETMGTDEDLHAA